MSDTKLTPKDRFEKLLKENNLGIQLGIPKIKQVSDGSLIIEQPDIVVFEIPPQKRKEVEEGTPRKEAEPDARGTKPEETTPLDKPPKKISN